MARFATDDLRAGVASVFARSAAAHLVTLHGIAVADDHVHALATLPDGGTTGLGEWMGNAKTHAYHEIRVQTGEVRPLWQRSFYDHVIRGEADFLEKARYIENHQYKESSEVNAEWH